MAICYEIALYCVPDLKAYIILSGRFEGDWLSQNREGVFSFIGYLAIFIAGMGTGLNILGRDPSPEDPVVEEKDTMDEDADWLASVLDASKMGEDAPAPAPKPMKMPQLKPELPKSTLPRLAFWTGLWFVFSTWAMWKYGPRLFVSRRMANLAYVCWVCCFNTAQLLLFCGVETIMFPNIYKAKNRAGEKERVKYATSKVMQAYNRNGLAIFLLANLLTGAINLSVNTLKMGDVPAMVILTSYMAVLTTVALVLDHFDVSIKL
jgi:phosphatidylinositol glycan class W